MPRKVTEYNYWKASELKLFLTVYYSLTVLKNVMRKKFFNHFLLFVYAIILLNSSSISDSMIEQAKTLLKKFVRDFEKLYGKKFMTCNLHLLLHLPDAVKKFGPL